MNAVKFPKAFIYTLLVSIFTFSTMQVSAANKTIGILVFDGVLTSDITAPAEVFGVASKKAWFSNYDVKFISVEEQPTITTEEGLTLTVDATINSDLVLDVLLVPSAYDMKPLLRNQKLGEFLKQQGQKVSWLASNCSGAFLLGHNGLLDGYRATTWFGGEKSLQRSFPKIDVVSDRNLVVDRNRITSNGSLTSYQAALVLLSKMSSEKDAREVFEAIQMERLVSWESVKIFM